MPMLYAAGPRSACDPVIPWSSAAQRYFKVFMLSSKVLPTGPIPISKIVSGVLFWSLRFSLGPPIPFYRDFQGFLPDIQRFFLDRGSHPFLEACLQV